MIDLSTLTDEQLFRATTRAYSRQAYIVDNYGSDNDSYEAERTCNRMEAELKHRNLMAAYDEWCEKRFK